MPPRSMPHGRTELIEALTTTRRNLSKAAGTDRKALKYYIYWLTDQLLAEQGRLTIDSEDTFPDRDILQT